MKKKTFLLFFLPLFSGLCHFPAGAQPLQDGQAVVTYYTNTATGDVASLIDVRANAQACPGENWSDDPLNCDNNVPIDHPSNWNRRRMGQVFGIAFDGSYNVFFAATNIYCLDFSYPVSNCDDFGPAGAGGVYKAEQSNVNLVHDFLQTAPVAGGSFVNTDSLPNTGAGLGNIAYDRWNDQFFITNLEDGKIYRVKELAAHQGTVQSAYDPFLPDDGIAGMAPLGERLWAVGVLQDEGGAVRVYFSRQRPSAKSEIWSVALDGAGEFAGPGVETLEITCPNNQKVTDIAFSSAGNMMITERGNPHNAHTYEYIGTHQAWSAPREFFVGSYGANVNSAGGLDYGYREAEQARWLCDSLVWVSGNALKFNDQNHDGDNTYVYGMTGLPASGNSQNSANSDYVKPSSIYVDYDENLGSSSVKGSMGDVEIAREACRQPRLCGAIGANAKEAEGDTPEGECCWDIVLNNEFAPGYFTAIQIKALDNAQLTYATGWNIMGFSASEVVMAPPGGQGIPYGTVDGFARICITGEGNASEHIAINWLGPWPDSAAVLCSDTLDVSCPGGEPMCLEVIDHEAYCKDGKVSLDFNFLNNSSFDVRAFVISPVDTGIQLSRQYFEVNPPLQPTQLSGMYTVGLFGNLVPGDTVCLKLTGHDELIDPEIGLFPTACCTDSVNLFCFVVPGCDPCEAVKTSARYVGADGCCWSISIDNQYLGDYFAGIQFEGLNGVQISYLSSWNIVPPVSASQVTVAHPYGPVPLGVHDSLAELCLSGFSSVPQELAIHWLGPDGGIACSDTLSFDCEVPPPPTCAVAVNDSLYCEGGAVKYAFHIQNSPFNTFDIWSFNLLAADTGIQLSQYYFELSSGLSPGSATGPFVVELSGDGVEAGQPFCFALTAHDGLFDPDEGLYFSTCCTDSVNVRCLPIPDCGDCCADCCNASALEVIPGFSPNGDGTNDLFEIGGLEKCSGVLLTVFNRWGDVVFEMDNYDNTWNGTGPGGNPLPEGTYFYILEVASNGSMSNGYIVLKR